MSKHIVYCFNMQSLFVQLHKKVGIVFDVIKL